MVLTGLLFPLTDDPDPSGQSFIIPAAINHGSWQLWFVSLCYWTVAALALIGCIRAIYTSNSFRASFLGVSFAMCFLRGFFTLVYFDNWSKHMFELYLVQIFLPTYLQYWTFALLILFVVKCLFVIHDRERSLRSCLYPVYHGLQFLVFGVICLTSFVLADQYHPSTPAQTDWDQRPAVIVFAIYSLLAIVGSYYSYKCFEMLRMSATLSTSNVNQERRARLRKFLWLIPYFILIFILRALWNITYYFNANPIQHAVANFMDKHELAAFDWAFLIFYLIFEIFPTLLVVILFTTTLPSAMTNHADDDQDTSAAGGGSTGGTGAALTTGTTNGTGLMHPGLMDGDDGGDDPSQPHHLLTTDLIDPSTPTRPGMHAYNGGSSGGDRAAAARQYPSTGGRSGLGGGGGDGITTSGGKGRTGGGGGKQLRYDEDDEYDDEYDAGGGYHEFPAALAAEQARRASGAAPQPIQYSGDDMEYDDDEMERRRQLLSRDLERQSAAYAAAAAAGLTSSGGGSGTGSTGGGGHERSRSHSTEHDHLHTIMSTNHHHQQQHQHQHQHQHAVITRPHTQPPPQQQQQQQSSPQPRLASPERATTQYPAAALPPPQPDPAAHAAAATSTSHPPADDEDVYYDRDGNPVRANS